MSLSDKIGATHLHDYFMKDGEHGCNPKVLQYFCDVDDIKDFIKQLRPHLNDWQQDRLDKLAGEILTTSKTNQTNQIHQTRSNSVQGEEVGDTVKGVRVRKSSLSSSGDSQTAQKTNKENSQ